VGKISETNERAAQRTPLVGTFGLVWPAVGLVRESQKHAVVSSRVIHDIRNCIVPIDIGWILFQEAAGNKNTLWIHLGRLQCMPDTMGGGSNGLWRL
jgi:hypothetical protein